MHDDVSRILQAHREELRYPMPEHLRRRLTRKPARRPLLGLAMAASLAVAFAVGRASVRPAGDPAQEVAGSHVRSLMAGHLQDVASSDRHQVKPWFEGRLDFAPDVRDFQAQGYPLAGGRLDYLGTRAVAALVYRRGGHVINLFQWPTSEPAQKPRLRTLRGFQIFDWRKDGFDYWAISDLNAAELQQFAQLWQ